MLVWLYWLWRPTKWEPSAPQWNLLMAISMVIGLSLGLHLFTYDLTLLLIPFFIILAHLPIKNGNAYLDAGPVYVWTILLYISASFGATMTKIQLDLTGLICGTTFALQLSTLAMIGWSISVYRYMKRESLR